MDRRNFLGIVGAGAAVASVGRCNTSALALTPLPPRTLIRIEGIDMDFWEMPTVMHNPRPTTQAMKAQPDGIVCRVETDKNPIMELRRVFMQRGKLFVQFPYMDTLTIEAVLVRVFVAARPMRNTWECDLTFQQNTTWVTYKCSE